jgi:hypothetical protein
LNSADIATRLRVSNGAGASRRELARDVEPPFLRLFAQPAVLHVVTSHRLIIGLIGVLPIFIFWDDGLARAFLAAYVAAAVVLVAVDVRPGEGGHLARVFRPVAIAATLPALWMIIQILPLPITGLLHPIWVSARETLHDSSLGSISIDPGATLLALTRYLTVIGIAFASAAVTIDRERAELTLLVAAAVGTLGAVLLALRGLGGLFSVAWVDGVAAASTMDAIAALGVLATSAAAIRAVERYETRRSMTESSFLQFSRSFLSCLVGVAICWAAVIFFARGPVIFAAACGFATMAWLLVVRRLGLGPWARAALAIAGIAGAAIVVLSQWGQANLGFSLRFAASSSPALISLAQRILSEASWAGSGAGTFAALVPIYRSGEDVAASATAPTAAADIVIELGWPALCVFLAIMALAAVLLMRGALERGRDSFYATAAAGCAVLIAVEAFCDPALASIAASAMAAVLLGLGVAQSVSRSLQ